MKLEMFNITTRLRASWATNDEHYEEVRQAVEDGKLLEIGCHLNPSGYLGSWNLRLIREMADGIQRLRDDGLNPRYAIIYRTDVVAGGDFDPDFPMELGMVQENMTDNGLRYLKAAREIGNGEPPRIENGLGDWLTQSGPMFDIMNVLGPCVLYYENHDQDRYTYEDVWRVRAVLLNPEHEYYYLWLAVCARKLRDTIVALHPHLSDITFNLHSKDKHYHIEPHGGFSWPPLTDFNETGHSSGLSTYPEPYRRIRNSVIRAKQLRAIELNGVPCIPRFWISSSWRDEYVEAVGGRDWVA